MPGRLKQVLFTVALMVVTSAMDTNASTTGEPPPDCEEGGTDCYSFKEYDPLGGGNYRCWEVWCNPMSGWCCTINKA